MVVPIGISCFNTIIVENYRLYYVLCMYAMIDVLW